MIFTKGAHKSAKFQNFDCSGEISPNLYFNRLLLLKVYKISAKKVQSSYVSWYWRKTNLFQKWQEFGKFWSQHSKVSKICTLIGPLRAMYITFDLKKYRGVIFHGTEEWCKIWRKTDLWLNGMKNLADFHQNTLKNLKIRNFIGFFYPK